MRKVLLATTAIVALGGVSAASADISVGASAEFQYDSWSGTNADSSTTNNNSISTTTDFSISASSVLDNGMTISARVFEDGSADGTASFAQNGFKISDDWGTLGFASDESGDAFATGLDITDDEGYNTLATISARKPSDEWIDAAEVSYLSPAVSGFQFSVGMADGAHGDTTMGGAQFSTSAGDATVTLKYAAQSTGKASSSAVGVDITSLGMVLAMGGATLTVAQQTWEQGSTSDYEASGAALAYTVSDALTLEMFTGETENSGTTDSSFKFKETGYGVTYTITPGLSLSLTNNTWDQDGTTDADGTNTAVALDLSF
ncbi:MAG: porin [Candidatus Puniceispirillaceae bacterium]